MISKLALRIFILATTLVFFSPNVKGQYVSGVMVPSEGAIANDSSDLSIKWASTITAEDMKAHLSILASDEYEGRETGKKGNDMAAEYIANHFKNLNLPSTGIEGSYYQDVAFTWTSWEELAISVNDKSYKNLWDFLSFPARNNDLEEFSTDDVVFLGFGIDDENYSDYKKNNVEGKVILIYSGEPVNGDSISQITKTKELSDWSTDWKKKLIAAKKHGVKTVLIVQEDIKGMLMKNRSRLLGPGLQLGDKTNEVVPYANAIYISSNIAKEIMGKKTKKVIKKRDRSKKKGKASEVKLTSTVTIAQKKKMSSLLGQNVLGFIEGSDLKEEVIVVSAHYDHLGKRGESIYNGADDNGSGTTTVLELAQAFATAKAEGDGPRRSILCLLVTGEEKGLLGSAYYAENPVYPIENTVCNVNIDMVGRVDSKYESNPNYIYVIGSDRLSSDLHRISETTNDKYAKLTLDYTYNSEDDPNRYYYRSDHYNFAAKGIPAIFYFNGVHPDYHRTSDTVEKINFDKMAKVGRLIFHTTWELANRDERIKVDGIIK